MIRIEYDPTQQKGLAAVSEGENGSGLRMIFNMAQWEDCPSKPILRSVVTHEMCHAVLNDLVRAGRVSHVPQWFDEGLATVAGGEPFRSISLDAAYYHYGSDYPGPVHCPFVSNSFELTGGGLLTDCYPFYMLAVQNIIESSPEALPRRKAKMPM